jgi:small conductance mechanosensitive channel
MWESAFQNVQSRAAEVWQLFSSWAGQHLLQIIIIIVAAELVYRISTKAVSKLVHKATHRPDLFPTASDRKKRIKTIDSLVNATLRISVFVVAGIMIISELGINTGPLLASAGIIGVALGFGAQSLIKDYMSGFFVITENQYRVGDVVELTTLLGGAQVSGTVEAITIRTTVIRDTDGKLHHFPNGNIAVASNMTMNYAQVNEDILVDVKTDVDKIAHIINHIGEEMKADPKLHRKIVQAPHFERVDALSKDGMLIKIMAKTTPGDQWLVKGELYRRLLPALEKNRIKLPVV